MELKYTTLKCADLDDKTLKLCSDLFSNHYGVYSGKDGKHERGQRIRLGIKYYMNIRRNPNMYVSLCYAGNELIAQAFFLKKSVVDGKICTWVTQLLVNKFYRGRGIATRLLHSAWGFSDYFAWGLATANALTVHALESVTWRKVEPLVIAEHIDIISQLCDEIPFAKDKQWELTDGCSQIFTSFFPEQEKTNTDVGAVYVEKLGELKDGYEWLAFTFQSQPMMLDDKHIEILLSFSAEQLNDAYSRMDMKKHGWTKHTQHEVDVVVREAKLKEGMRVLDLGCGMGRHTIELAKRGMQVVAVEPSAQLMDVAISEAFENLELKQIDAITFLPVDGRKTLLVPGTFDAVISLYDVIGSYRKRQDNIALLKTIHSKLKEGGRAVISIMNMDLTKSIATNRCSIYEEPQRLLRLKASNIMQRTGNVFDPDYFLLDEESHLVYRKEQFESDEQLSTEYVIADYRFTIEEFASECTALGFKVRSISPVQLGHWDAPLDPFDIRAKEVVFVVEK